MNALLSSAALRNLICDVAEEFYAINSTTLPDGAELFLNENKSLYRLDKDAGATFDDLIESGIVVKPNDGTAARWIAQSIGGSDPYRYSAYLNGVATVTIAASNTWGLLGNQAASFVRSAGNAELYTLNPTTGLVTYNGPARWVLARAIASFSDATGTNAVTVSLVLSHSNDVPSGATGPKPALGQQQSDLDATLAQVSVSTERIVQLVPGSTLQLGFRNAVNGDDITVGNYQLVIIPL